MKKHFFPPLPDVIGFDRDWSQVDDDVFSIVSIAMQDRY